MKRLCVALLVLLGYQALAYPKVKQQQQQQQQQQPILNSVLMKNIKGHDFAPLLDARNIKEQVKKTTPASVGVIDEQLKKTTPAAVRSIKEQLKKTTPTSVEVIEEQVKKTTHEAVNNSSHGKFRSVCGGIYNAESGTIQHPATFGDNYRNNEDCSWIINSAVPLYISFSHFNTESWYDRLYIRDGSSIDSPLLGSFSGSTLPTTLTTTGAAHIQFTSDYSVVNTGFVLNWNIDTQMWRDDYRCGSNYPLPDGRPSQCPGRCCSSANWCGDTSAHCSCSGCIDYRARDDYRCGSNYPLPNGRPSQCPGRCCSSYNWCGDTSAHCSCSGCIDYRDDSRMLQTNGHVRAIMNHVNNSIVQVKDTMDHVEEFVVHVKDIMDDKDQEQNGKTHLEDTMGHVKYTKYQVKDDKDQVKKGRQHMVDIMDDVKDTKAQVKDKATMG